MNGQELVENVRSERATELDRLGSEKSVVAATGAQLEQEPVLSAAARTLDDAADALVAWADETDHEEARAAFADAADTLAGHRDALLDLDDGASVRGEPPFDVDQLWTVETTAERVAVGLVAYPLVADRFLLQVINFLVNEGSRGEADTVREARDDLQAMPDEAADLLDAVCDEDDWVPAGAAANDAIAAAYAEYAERLEEMGVDPKPVC
ncbi:MAG: hypothetical protein ABEJ05_11970 [Haloglomus sp.]